MSDPPPIPNQHYPPYVKLASIEDPSPREIPDLAVFQRLSAGEKLVRAYHVRVRRPKFPWLAFFLSLLLIIWVLPMILVLVYHFFLQSRGHTFLYLTTRRLVIVELEQGVFGKRQTVLNYNNEDIAGFQLYTQRGLIKLFNLLTLREKRTFYISILTGTLARFELGAINSRTSSYDPGSDAVALCAELDSTLLSVKAGHWRKSGGETE